MTHYRIPGSEQEINSLQKATTALLKKYTEAMTNRRLQAKGIEPSRVGDADQRKAMAGTPSEATQKEYLKTGNRLLKNAPPGIDAWAWAAEKSSSKGAWYKNRASLQFTLIARIKKSKLEIDAIVRALQKGDVSPELLAQSRTAFNVLVDSANQLEAMPEAGMPDALTLDGKSKRPRQSKARSLRGLPDEWRETVAELMPEDLRISWLTQCLTGARPAEIAKGVSAAFTDGKLVLVVTGAKVRKGHAGQEKRELIFDASSGMARMLFALLDGRPSVIGSDRNANAYRSLVAYYCKKASPERKGAARTSAYSARHAFKADLKAAERSPTAIAMAMGHVSTESASYYYGGTGKRTGAVTPISVRATNKVKVRAPYSSGQTNKSSPRAVLKLKPSAGN